MKRDLITKFEVGESLNLADITATTTGSAVDMLNHLDILCICAVGPVTTADASNYFTYSWTECATSAGTYTAVPAAQITTIDSWDKIVNATTEAGNIHVVQIEMTPGMRYLKCVATETGTAQATLGGTFFFTEKTQPASA